jgi:hypothetical protein
VSALSFVADENEAGERCVEVMGFCDEEDEHAQAGGK